MTVFMSSLTLELGPLYAWAASVGVPIRDNDLGYAVHSALRAAFGEWGPQPFAVQGVNGAQPQVLGYGPADAETLKAQRALFADPLLAAVFPEQGILTKPMPLGSFTAGLHLGFALRACPVIRQDAGQRDKSRETDAFIAATLAHPGRPVDREAVYRDWLARHIEKDRAARVIDLRMTSFQRVVVNRRDAARAPRSHEKPDAAFAGLLEIVDPQAFARLLTRGIGRHRAFGFGMLLLRPPQPGAAC